MRMAIRDEDPGPDLTPVEGDAGIWSPSRTAPARERRDWQSLYERQRARAEAAEARCEELRRAELESRSRAGSLKSQLDTSRTKLRAAVPAPEPRPRGAPRRLRNSEEKIASLREENAELKKEQRAAKGLESKIKFLDRELDNPPDDLEPWLPWSMSKDRRRALAAPG